MLLYFLQHAPTAQGILNMDMKEITPTETRFIPGTSSLGLGFNVFGDYGASSLKAPLFDIELFNIGNEGTPGGTFVKAQNTHYNSDVASGESRSFVYASRKSYQESLAAKVKISGKIGAFKGAFDASFDMKSSNEDRYLYGAYVQTLRFWELSIQDKSWKNLSDQILTDPVFKEVPDIYTKDNAHLFFRFFHKYGCHFVTKVTLGARINYFSKIAKSYSEEELAIKAKLKLEYETVLTKAEGEVEASWKELGKEWTDHRESYMQILGGDKVVISKLSGITPAFGEAASHKSLYDAWLNSLKENPSVIDYELSPIEEIFSGDKVSQVRKAAGVYSGSIIAVKSQGSLIGQFSAILLNGKSIPTDNPTLEEAFHLVVINPSTLAVEFNKTYIYLGRQESPSISHQLKSDIEKENGWNGMIVAMNVRGKFSGNKLMPFLPKRLFSSSIKEFLYACGVSGKVLDEWGLDDKGITFAAVGISGGAPESALVDYQSINNVGEHLRSAELLALLEPQYLGNGKVTFHPAGV